MNWEKAGDFALQFLEANFDPNYAYHSPAHTLDVVAASKRLIEMEAMEEHLGFCVQTAAWFHEIGMLGGYESHEQRSADFCRKELPAFGYSGADIDYICELILATRAGVVPGTPGAAILCDADMDYLGREDYFEIAGKLRQEWESLQVIRYTDRGWLEFQLRFLGDHRFRTPAARQLRDLVKLKNINELKRLLKII